MSVTTPTRTPRLTSTEVLAGGGVLALGVACLLAPAGIEDGPVLCPFRRLTGLPCPGCGLTRSWTYLMHGWWRESFLAHPFGPLAAALVVVLALLALRARHRRTAGPDLDRLAKHPVTIVVAVAWLVFSIVRLCLAL